MSDGIGRLSRAQQFRRLPATARGQALQKLSAPELALLLHDWPFWARPAQLPPQGDWRVWLILAGRGFGKTRAGAEWIRSLAIAHPNMRLALVAATYAEGRAVMIEGDSGLLNVGPPELRPVYESSLRRLRWRNGSQALLYSAEDAEGLRGPQHHAAWCDELAKWAHAEDTWMNLDMGLRLGLQQHVCVTTTPRPTALLRKLMARDDMVLTRGRMVDNSSNLSASFIRSVEQHYAGTRLGRQELDGEFLEDVAGALWSRAQLEACHVSIVPPMRRIVVGVDPPVTSGAAADACGIIACGLGTDGKAYVLQDATVQGLSPDGWARAVAQCSAQMQADRVIAECNNGGELVRAVLHQVAPDLPITLVRASHGKVARAEPIAALYEQGRVHHAAHMPLLEDELCGFCAGGEYQGPGRSPDRADALVWALTTLMLGTAKTPLVRSL
jgi:phage terminase large subunit-like protein